jgi:hypothetical protein
MATACFGSVTFLPLLPLLSFPCFIAFISVSTLFEAAGEYFRADDFFALLFFALAVVAIVTLLVDPIFRWSRCLSSCPKPEFRPQNPSKIERRSGIFGMFQEGNRR